MTWLACTVGFTVFLSPSVAFSIHFWTFSILSFVIQILTHKTIKNETTLFPVTDTRVVHFESVCLVRHVFNIWKSIPTGKHVLHLKIYVWTSVKMYVWTCERVRNLKKCMSEHVTMFYMWKCVCTGEHVLHVKMYVCTGELVLRVKMYVCTGERVLQRLCHCGSERLSPHCSRTLWCTLCPAQTFCPGEIGIIWSCCYCYFCFMYMHYFCFLHVFCKDFVLLLSGQECGRIMCVCMCVCVCVCVSGMPIFRYFPFFPLFLAQSVLRRSVSRFLFFSPIVPFVC